MEDEQKKGERNPGANTPKSSIPLNKDVQLKHELVEKSQISLALDTYDDIFSDFDPRPYQNRALSDDFLQEAKRASRDKAEGTIELIFIMPADKRDIANESLIKRRMREHFRKHHSMMHDESRRVVKRGVNFIFAGIVIMLITTFILFKSGNWGFLKNFMIVLLEPAGWFLFWEGLNQAIFESRKKFPEMDFYHKMSKADITFTAY
ncbi:hypothetical protein COV19_06785 [Candidatus Woesearchaeota archaeon CG10_big_fil_rev_8_21_14_0_10_44_13]|nr:MAG: hypothetical protein COV19_06785 [Candidatus Woesearchaeota archaeon CG10_big_fil_rev_8_21_14_0_10_44_13]